MPSIHLNMEKFIEVELKPNKTVVSIMTDKISYVLKHSDGTVGVVLTSMLQQNMLNINMEYSAFMTLLN